MPPAGRAVGALSGYTVVSLDELPRANGAHPKEDPFARLARGDVDALALPWDEGLSGRCEEADADLAGALPRGDARDVLILNGARAASIRDVRVSLPVAAPAPLSRRLLRAHRPDIRVIESNGLRDDLARVDGGELSGVLASIEEAESRGVNAQPGIVLDEPEWLGEAGRATYGVMVRAGDAAARASALRAACPDATACARLELEADRRIRLAGGPEARGVFADAFPGGARLSAILVSPRGDRLVRGRVVAEGPDRYETLLEEMMKLLAARGLQSLGPC